MFFFFKQKTAYEMRISDWSSDVCSPDLYVTSSNTTVGGALAGTGVGADAIDYVLGIAKAYATRVGGGPFPTELHDEVGQGIRDRGQEYGASTGRPRRCGWIDIVALKRAVAINGI